MGEKTGIAWCDHSFNPWIGCTRVSVEASGGGGCDHCYAEAMDARRRWDGGRTHWGAGVPRYRTSVGNWKHPLSWDNKAFLAGERRTVFPSLCDPFDNEVPDRWRNDLLDLIRATPNLTWLLLSKRIGNAAKMMPFLIDNVWLGASVVNQEEADRDIPKLLATPASKRFVSYEPALGPVDFESYFEQYPDHNGVRVVQNDVGIDWLIVGGESSQGSAKARPFDLAWARSTVAQCRAAGVACFVKQLGSSPFEIDPNPTHGAFNCAGDYKMRRAWLNLKDRAGADPAEWPADLQVQQFPE